MNSLLISVHGKHCEKYANGTKTIEIRKQKPLKDFKRTVYIYNTDTQKIEFKGILLDVLKLPYSVVNQKCLRRGGLSSKELKLYAGQKESLVLLDFFHVHRLNNPVSIIEMRKAGINPPQSYLYFDENILNLN